MASVAVAPSGRATPRTRSRAGGAAHFHRQAIDDDVELAIGARASTPAREPEALLLARCAAQIAAAAGAGALVYVPGSAFALLDADDLLALLSGVTARHGADALLVVAVSGPPDAGRARAATTRTIGAELALLEQLARATGWQLCQLWTDGTARHALAVLERTDSAAAVRAS